MEQSDFTFQPSLRSEVSSNTLNAPLHTVKVERSDQSLISSYAFKKPADDDHDIPPVPPLQIPPQVDGLDQAPTQTFDNTETVRQTERRKDGGFHAWLVCFGVWCAFTSSFGWLNSVGVFQDYYQKHFLQNYSNLDISWISSVQVFMIFSGGIVFGKLFDDNGPRWLLVVGTFLQVFGLVMTAGSTQYYQFFLAQAVCSSIGASCIYYASAGAISTWFIKKRATAFGIAATGSSIGGVFFPIMVFRLVERIGFPWTMRIVALIVFVLNVIAILTVKSLLVHTHKPFSIWKYLHQFKDVPFVCLLVGMTMFSFGLWVPINYLITQGQAAGMSESLAHLFGRFLPGILADRFGRFNIMFLATIVSGVLTLALWIPAKSNVPIIIYAAFYGFFSGAYVSLGPTVVGQISNIKEIGLRNGVLYFCVGIAVLVGSPIGGQLVTAMNGNFLGLQLFAGVTMVVGACIILSSRVMIAGFGWQVV
ncbi:MAG: hypothetical protein Q9165_008723 [Trypethelium subeluteriae]